MLFNQKSREIHFYETYEVTMFVNHVTLSGGQQIPIHHQAREILHALVCPRIDVQRVFVLGQRLFEVGGSVALEAMIDCCATIKTGHPATICHTSDGGAVSGGQADVKPEAASGGSPKG
jgi:hypothetical protein